GVRACGVKISTLSFSEIEYSNSPNSYLRFSKPRNPITSCFCVSLRAGSIYSQLELMDQKAGDDSSCVKKIISTCDVEALKKCLEENKGDYVKCQSQIESFKSSCSLRKTNLSLDSALH
ncbi:hypothetical protein glysoja_006121, partial [Glycine soja]